MAGTHNVDKPARRGAGGSQRKNKTTPLRFVKSAPIFLLRFRISETTFGVRTMRYKAASLSLLAAAAFAVTPFAPASAHGWHHHGGGVVFGIAGAAAAVVGTAALVATAPFRALAPAPVYAAPPPAPAYYAPPAPSYYAPPPNYYAPPPQAYYYPPQGYYGR
jgi:hypothetical protein